MISRTGCSALVMILVGLLGFGLLENLSSFDTAAPDAGPPVLEAITATASQPYTPPPPKFSYTVSGRVAEFPGCQGAMRGVNVVLESGDATQYSLDVTQTSLDDGSFRFENVREGIYFLRVEPACNPFGCFEEASILISGIDIENIRLCPAVFETPYAPPTSTPIPSPTYTYAVTPTQSLTPTANIQTRLKHP
ncbi:MAG: hypothetical protein JW966_01855 [Anaerolineae bacterium]|nr:hypothetical protein [Anaerolineae bacterium]